MAARKKFPFKVEVYTNVIISKEFQVEAADEAAAEALAIEQASKGSTFLDWEIEDDDPETSEFIASVTDCSEEFVSKLTKNLGGVTPSGGLVCAAPRGAPDV